MLAQSGRAALDEAPIGYLAFEQPDPSSRAARPSRAARNTFSSRISGGGSGSRGEPRLELQVDEALNERGERPGLPARALGIHDPHLDRAQTRL